MAPNKKSIPERFWPKVNKQSTTFGASGQYPTNCWEWTGSLRPNGYGWFALGKRSDGTISAHRMSWIITHGQTSLNVLHDCDNRKCVRPDHLFEGTQKENIQDMKQKGRSQMKITDEQVKDIRTLANHGYTQKALAMRFGVSPSLVSQIIRYKKRNSA